MWSTPRSFADIFDGTKEVKGLGARFAPTIFPAFHGRLSRLAGSNSECPILSSSWPDWPSRGMAARARGASYDRGRLRAGRIAARRLPCWD